MVDSSWQPAVVDPARPGGWALAHCRQRFVCGSSGVLFPRDWLKAQLPAVLSEQGIGYLQGQPVFVLELVDNTELLPSGCSWKGLRQFLLEGDLPTFRMLGYAAQVATWARQHRFCGSCGGLLQPLGSTSLDASDQPAPAKNSIAPIALDTSALATIPEPQAPTPILHGESPATTGSRSAPTTAAPSREALKSTGAAPAIETSGGGSEASLAGVATNSPEVVSATGATAVAEGSVATEAAPTESVLVTAPTAAGQLPAGSVVDRARMAAVDRVAQENGVKLVWLNPPVLDAAVGSAPDIGADTPELTTNMAADSQARAIAILQQQPEFPDRARLDSIEGWVTVSYVIGRDGRVSNVSIVAAQPRNVFEGAVRKAVRSWRFEPVRVNGEPVEQKKTQTIRFSLSDVQPTGDEVCMASTGSRICRPAAH